MHAFNIPQTFIECEKIGMRPCCSISSEEMKRASFIDKVTYDPSYMDVAFPANVTKTTQETVGRKVSWQITKGPETQTHGVI